MDKDNEIFYPAKGFGRPTKYREEYNEQARKYCLLGATNKQLADFFEVNEDTIYEWIRLYPDFSESIKNGKERADAEIAHSLYHRAKGFTHPDIKILTVAMPDGGSEVVQVPITRVYPPDPASMIFWLKNRRKDRWRDKQEIDVNVNTVEVSLDLGNETPVQATTTNP
jgi:hypothetical protein